LAVGTAAGVCGGVSASGAACCGAAGGCAEHAAEQRTRLSAVVVVGGAAPGVLHLDVAMWWRTGWALAGIPGTSGGLGLDLKNGAVPGRDSRRWIFPAVQVI
jgi:hypothetical protein